MLDETPQSFDYVLSSMCTEPHPAARSAAERFLATNPGDPASYPTVAALEEAVIEQLGKVVGLADPSGYVASGGTEANIQAVRVARNRTAVSNPNIVVPESAHFSFEKAAELLGVELRRTVTDADHRADVGAMEQSIDEDTILIVGVAGSTEYGRVDPIPAIGDLGTEHGIHVHVDAAWGGFILPFTDIPWHFGHASVDTMTIDPHKLGRAAIPAGGFLARSPDLLASLRIKTPYLESGNQITLGGTRSGAGVASAKAAFDALWPDGYEAQFHKAMAVATWFAEALADRGFSVISPTFPIVTTPCPDALFTALRSEGWRIARTHAGELRIVCMPHVTRERLEAFLGDLDRCNQQVSERSV